MELISNLEREIGARVMSFITGDRQGMETRIAPDVLPLITEHLSRIGPTDTLALFLYTAGGDTIAGWGLVSLLRQYCANLIVLVPFRALSCGTLIALGADKIWMGRHGFLSPIDPSVASPFNPQAPGVQQPGSVSLLPVSVEDMIGFLELARTEIQLTSEKSLCEVLKILSEKVHPLALGAVYRAREQSSSLAKRLLLHHSKDEKGAEEIVKKLTKELPTHNYLIGRKEASIDIGLDIVEPPNHVEQLLWHLYKEYENWLKLTSPTSVELDLGEDDNKIIRYERACIESISDGSLAQHIFITQKMLSKVAVTATGTQEPIHQIAERKIYEGWTFNIQRGEI